jgi:hypothetical protein
MTGNPRRHSDGGSHSSYFLFSRMVRSAMGNATDLPKQQTGMQGHLVDKGPHRSKDDVIVIVSVASCFVQADVAAWMSLAH